jgi:hypothetical protein
MGAVEVMYHIFAIVVMIVMPRYYPYFPSSQSAPKSHGIELSERPDSLGVRTRHGTDTMPTPNLLVGGDPTDRMMLAHLLRVRRRPAVLSNECPSGVDELEIESTSV